MTHTHSERQRRVHESVDEVRYRETLEREIGGHLSEDVHDSIDDEGHDDVAHEQRSRADCGERGSASDKQASTNSTTCMIVSDGLSSQGRLTYLEQGTEFDETRDLS